ncbi:uncharacterized protein PAC_16624 [Phialocephala subalpina]|uniref:Permease of the major facilitator superfamily n=1 Tax=Phialocephala subalpina TaxID=576137 RepID=A0A1L7XNX2_9HELO|nr:uncharacterized protein PAC_16624 [Phialocephala subalpina]
MTIEIISETTEAEYILYKRRWYGVLIWALINLMTSWVWITYSSISSVSAEFYKVSENAVNSLALHIWVVSAGVARDTGNDWCGAPFTALPLYNLWFSGNSKVAANAIMSLSNPTGAAYLFLSAMLTLWKLAQLIGPAICSGVTVLSIFVPAKPPTLPSMSLEEEKIHPKTAIMLLAKNPRFWLFSIPFVIFVGFFNTVGSLLFQMLSPYGVSPATSGYLGAVLIDCGRVTATIVSLIIDKF